MWISSAWATETTDFEVDPPSMNQAFMYNAAFIFFVVLMFYFIFIRPQQKRMTEHVDMLNALKVGDEVVTGGGLVGKVSKLLDDREIQVDLGDIKVVALRSTLLERPASVKSGKTEKKEAPKEDKKDKK